MDLTGVFVDSWEFWKNNWQKLVLPFAALVVIGIVIAIVELIIGFALGFMSGVVELAARQVAGPLVGPLFDIFVRLANWLIDFVLSAIVAVVAFSIWRPFWDAMNGKEPADFVEQIKEVWLKAVVIYFGRAIMLGIPLVVIIAAGAAIFVFMLGMGSSQTGIASIAAYIVGLFVLLMAILLALIVRFVLTMLLDFWEIEVAVAGRGVLEGLQASYQMVLENFVTVLIFNILWIGLDVAIGIASSIVVICTFCLATPLLWLVEPFVIRPMKMGAILHLWKGLKGQEQNQLPIA